MALTLGAARFDLVNPVAARGGNAINHEIYNSVAVLNIRACSHHQCVGRDHSTFSIIGSLHTLLAYHEAAGHIREMRFPRQDVGVVIILCGFCPLHLAAMIEMCIDCHD